MSSSDKKPPENGSEEKLSNLRAILGYEIPRARLVQILEASNGSLEHAIEIYFHQENQEMERTNVKDTDNVKGDYSPLDQHDCSSKNERKPEISNRNEYEDVESVAANKKRSQTRMASNHTKKSPSKQARLDSFFRVDSAKVIGSLKQLGRKDLTGTIVKRETLETIQNSDLENFNRTYEETMDKTPTAEDTAKTKMFAPKVCNDNDMKKGCPDACSDTSYVSFRRLCEALQEMTDTTKRLTKLKVLETFIREVVYSDSTVDKRCNRGERSHVSMRVNTLSSALGLMLGGGTSSPLNISGSAVSKALQTSLGITRNQISKAYRHYGDLGDCAASFFQKKTHFLVTSNARRQLSILQVTEGLSKVTETTGRDAKQHVLHSLLQSCKSKIECRFLVRLLLRNMRIGANIKTVLAALAMAMVPASINAVVGDENKERNECNSLKKPGMDTKDAITMVQKTYDVCPDISKIVAALLEGGFDQMQRVCSIQVMTPIAPMLAHPVHSLDELKERIGNDGEIATMEWKYDGMRCQAHYDGVNIQLFSRHMLDMTNQFQDVVKYLLDTIRSSSPNCCRSFIIDAEIVGIEGEGRDSRLLPFQDLSTRRKKMDDGKGIKVKVFVFDLMFFNGKSLVNEQFHKRRSLLQKMFVETTNFTFVSSQNLMSYDENVITSYLSEAIAGGAEGLMVKLLGEKPISATNEGIKSFYEAGTRSHCWLKVKRDYVAGFSDTIDVVPIGAWWGTGRKAQKSFLSPVLLAVYDDEEEVFRSICRCMSFTDAMYESIRKFYFNGIEYPTFFDSGVLENEGINPEKKVINGGGLSSNEDDGDGSCGKKGIDDHCQDTDGSIMAEGGEEQKDRNRVHCFPDRPSSAFVITNESPPIWFKPMEVFEVAFADLSLSRQHTAAAGLVDEEGRGVALRFPRFKRRRPDKKPEQATTSIEIAQLFAKQSKIKK